MIVLSAKLRGQLLSCSQKDAAQSRTRDLIEYKSGKRACFHSWVSLGYWLLYRTTTEEALKKLSGSVTAQHLPQLNQYCHEGQVPKVNNQSRVKLIHLGSLKMLVWSFLDKSSIIPAKKERCWGPAPRSAQEWEWGAGFTPVMCTNVLIKWKSGANKLGKKGFGLALIASSVLGTHGLVLWKIFHCNINWGYVWR